MRQTALSSTTPVGRILLRRLGDGSVRLDNYRLTDIAPALAARPLSDAPRLARMLLPVCGWAQGLACLTALEQAIGKIAAPETRAARALLAEAEVAARFVWHACIDWPRLLGRPVEAAPLRLAQTALGTLVEQLWNLADPLASKTPAAPLDRAAQPADRLAEAVEATVIPGCPDAARDATRNTADWANWATTSAAPLAALIRKAQALRLPEVTPDAPLPPLSEIVAALDRDAGFARAPHAAGRPADPAQADPFGAPISEGSRPDLRLLACGAAAQGLVRRLRALDPAPIRALSPAAATGAACIATLRGPLVHLLRLDRPDPVQGRLVRFRTLAPTEWMLHPEGALTRALSALAEPDFNTFAPLVAAAFDPCAELEIVAPKEIAHA